MELGILGPLVVVARDGQSCGIEGIKARGLLALLLTHPHQALTADRLEDELWPAGPPAGARATLHAHVCRVRRVLRDAGTQANIRSHRSAYELVTDPATIDAGQFEQQLGRAQRADDLGVRRRLLDDALGRWRGAALVDAGDAPALALEAARLGELRLGAVEDRIDAVLARGEHHLVVAELAALVKIHPYRERLHGQLMLALYRAGRQVEALRAYQAAYRVLTDEIGVTPGPELRALERRIAAHEPDLARPAAAQPRGPSTRLSMTRAAPDRGAPECRRLLAVGAEASAGYDLSASLGAYRRALALAHEAGDAELLAEAACGLARASEYRGGDGELVDLLGGILGEVGDGFSPLRVKLMTALARSLPPGAPTAVGLAGEAVAAARQFGDDELVAQAMATQCLVAWGPDDAHARVERAGAVIAAARARGWLELEVEAVNWRAVAREEIGDRKGAGTDAAVVAPWATRPERPFLTALARMRATADSLHAGDLAAARTLLDEPHPAVAASANFAAAHLAQRFTLARLEGQVGQLADALAALADDPDAAPAWRAAAAVGLAESGRVDAAAAILEAALAECHRLPRDWLWLGAVVHWAEAAVELGHRRAAATIDELLAPFTDRIAVLAHGVLRLGAVAGRRGELALVLGDLDAAEQQLRTAVAINDRTGARPAAARCRRAWVAALRTRGRRGDDERAARLTAEATFATARSC